MLALTEDTLVAHEPFNIEPWAYALDGLAKHWFTYAPALPQDAALEVFDKVLRRRTRKIFLKVQPQYWLPPLRGGRLIVKDPRGLCSRGVSCIFGFLLSRADKTGYQ